MASVQFRQGIIAYQKDQQGHITYLQKIGDYVNLLANNTPTTITFAHRSSNYTVEEWATVNNAWGPLTSSTVTYYLYWDLDLVSGQLTRSYTIYSPIYSSSAPPAVIDQHWFDTKNTTMKVWNGLKWVEKIRVFAGSFNNSTLYPQLLGSQANIQGNFSSGYIVKDADGSPIRRPNGEFFTTETNIYANYSPTAAGAKFEGSLIPVVAAENIEKFSLVAVTDANKVMKAKLADITAGIITQVTITDGGTGYATTPTVTIVGGEGLGATAIATVIDGVVTQVTVTNGGTDYVKTPPQVVFTGGNPIRPATAKAAISRLAIGLMDRTVTTGEVGNLIFRGLVYNDVWQFPAESIGASAYCGLNGEVVPTRPTGGVVQKIGTILNSNSIYLDIDEETVAALLAGVTTVASLNVVEPLKREGTHNNPILSIPPASSTVNGYMTAVQVNAISTNANAIALEALNRATEDDRRVLKSGDTMVGTLKLSPGGALSTDLIIESKPGVNSRILMRSTEASSAEMVMGFGNGLTALTATNTSPLIITTGITEDGIRTTILEITNDNRVDVKDKRIVGMLSPVDPTDGATKAYVDDHANDTTVHLLPSQKIWLNGVTPFVTPTEVVFLSGVTSSIQAQLNSKLSKAGGTLSGQVYQALVPDSGQALVNKSYVDNAISTSAAGSLRSYKHVQSTQDTQWNVVHNLGTTDLTWGIYEQMPNGSYSPIIPADIIINNTNSLTVVFNQPRAGRVALVGLI